MRNSCAAPIPATALLADRVGISEEFAAHGIADHSEARPPIDFVRLEESTRDQSFVVDREIGRRYTGHAGVPVAIAKFRAALRGVGGGRLRDDLRLAL